MLYMTEKNLKLAVWNIEGLNNDKINDPHFQHIVAQFDIIGFVETWTNDIDQKLLIPGFQLLCESNRTKHKNARRNSGGIILYVKNAITKGITRIQKSHSDILWIILNQNFFNLTKDLYIATIYFSPENLSIHSSSIANIEKVYDKLLSDVTKYSKFGHVMVQGDFNAYTNTKPDYVAFDISSDTDSDNHCIRDHEMPRNNLDIKLVNNSGKHLLNLCKETGLRIINGRTIGDLLGNFTCITYNGCSVVDYMLVSQERKL